MGEGIFQLKKHLKNIWRGCIKIDAFLLEVTTLIGNHLLIRVPFSGRFHEIALFAPKSFLVLFFNLFSSIKWKIDTMFFCSRIGSDCIF